MSVFAQIVTRIALSHVFVIISWALTLIFLSLFLWSFVQILVNFEVLRCELVRFGQLILLWFLFNPPINFQITFVRVRIGHFKPLQLANSHLLRAIPRKAILKVSVCCEIGRAFTKHLIMRRNKSSCRCTIWLEIIYLSLCVLPEAWTTAQKHRVLEKTLVGGASAILRNMALLVVKLCIVY